MNLKFALRTLTLLAAWLILQNFNIVAAHNGNFPERTRCKAERNIQGSTVNGQHCSAECGKSMESLWVAEGFSQAASLLRRPPSAAYRIKKVVLDAGHGGKDPGCIGASSKEKDNALAIVLKLGEMIRGAFPEVEVIYTRQTDVFVELNERAAIANRNKADLFISVHCNSIRVSSVKGTETYVMGLHKTEHNLEVAKRENASIYLEDNYEKNYEGYDPNSPEAHIIGSVWQSAYLEQSILFASFVQQFARSTAFRDDRGVKQAGFIVLRETAMPSVLVEAGFLTNRSEEDFIASEEGQAQMAQAIFEAFEAYKIKVEGNSVAEQPNTNAKMAATTSKTPSAQQKSSAGTSTGNAPKSVQIPATVEKQPERPATKTVAQSKTQASKPAASANNASAKGPFRIFLLSWPVRMDRNAGQLGLVGDVKEEKIEGQYHYFSGHYATRAEAEQMLPEIRNLGFRTAAIVTVGSAK